MRRLHCIVYGDVQGVFLREFTKESAVELGLFGTVRNRPDGTVEIIAEGRESLLRILLHRLRENYPHAHIERIDEAWSDATGEFTDFNIRRG